MNNTNKESTIVELSPAQIECVAGAGGSGVEPPKVNATLPGYGTASEDESALPTV